ncbi:MAG TPA: type IV toxin-antitoxin system AbiEi family antitoxin [Acidimicrobiales bacterium]|nr:type IV toxin-antitoxin system AbiEi family antitoxin [Acidimicrobiales bacterium]
MQNTGRILEREVRQRLPRLLAELLDDESVIVEPAERDQRVDFVALDGRGHRWLVEVKNSGGPGQIADAAQQLRALKDKHAISLLVVPFMSSAGAEVAEREQLNWIDLSGNGHVRAADLYLWVQGRPNELRTKGRPSSPFAPKSARIARTLLLAPERWWRQKDLVHATGLDDGNVSRVVRRLEEEMLLERRGLELRPRDPNVLLDAWAQDYRFDGHDILTGHLSGSGIDLSSKISGQLHGLGVHHAFTGLAAAWAFDRFAQFRLSTVYIDTDPREVAEQLGMRPDTRGANVQIVGPNDSGVFAAEADHDGIRCVAPVQIYLDLLHLPERSAEAAQHLRSLHLRWQGRDAR